MYSQKQEKFHIRIPKLSFTFSFLFPSELTILIYVQFLHHHHKLQTLRWRRVIPSKPCKLQPTLPRLLPVIQQTIMFMLNKFLLRPLAVGMAFGKDGKFCFYCHLFSFKFLLYPFLSVSKFVISYVIQLRSFVLLLHGWHVLLRLD